VVGSGHWHQPSHDDAAFPSRSLPAELEGDRSLSARLRKRKSRLLDSLPHSTSEVNVGLALSDLARAAPPRLPMWFSAKSNIVIIDGPEGLRLELVMSESPSATA
jgi:hypothetical protein